MVNCDHRAIQSAVHHFCRKGGQPAISPNRRCRNVRGEILKNIRFVVKVSRGSLAPAFVQRVDPPVQMTTNRKLALIMGTFTAEDAIKSIRNSKCVPELVPVQMDM